jgi:flagellar motility protein MotE (MotC chaperone)
VKSPRLLPIVIFAALALLFFKSVGLLTNGGYVLTGTNAAIAAEGVDAAPSAGTTTTDITLADTSPTLSDEQPTLAAKAEASSSEAPPESSASTEGAASSEAPSSAPPPPGPSEQPSSAQDTAANTACPNIDPALLASISSEAAAQKEHAATEGGLTDKIGSALATGCPSVEPPVNENGDALPTTKDSEGHIVPLNKVSGDNAQAALSDRLSTRREELDKYASDLDMRASLIEAAEKRIVDRTAELQALESQIAALVDQKQAEQDAQFKAVVSMYETMKPKDAAKIFDSLEMNVLLRVARAMNPRKMAPVLAAMSAAKAQALTSAMAVDTPPPHVAAASAGGNLADLPQIVGK